MVQLGLYPQVQVEMVVLVVEVVEANLALMVVLVQVEDLLLILEQMQVIK